MTSDDIFSCTLSNGLRVVHLASDSEVAYCGLAVDAGSRDEAPGKFGLAHFVEHTIFKGTRRRKAWHIINRMERVGGELNAYTTKEETMVYSVFPREHFSRAAELIADLVANSSFPDAELAKEREVVLDEVNSYLDAPSEAVYDDFEDLIWTGSALGHNILGCEADLQGITGADCREYLDCLYVPKNMVFFALGNMRHEYVARTAERYFGSLCQPLRRNARIAPAPVTPFGISRSIESHQSHTIYGAPACSMHDEERYAMLLLSNILGGPGMNARLNLSLRERHGLVYTVESSMVSYSDTGVWCVYFGCDPHDVARCRRLVMKELQRVTEKPLSTAQLNAAKRQIKGQLGVACDNRESFALDFGKSFLHYGWEKDIHNLFKRIDALTAEQIQQVAQETFAPERLTTLIIR